jgi:nitroreductase
MSKIARPDHDIEELITKRWSPYAFDPRPVSREDLCALFEAARWAASSFNEQPWRFIVATQENTDGFEQMIGCLAEPNQAWAGKAYALALGITRDTFTRNDKPNRVALHDLGLAAANLTFEATARGLAVHQMAGIVPEKIIEIYSVPNGFTPQTAIAIGYAADPSTLPDDLRPRDEAPRSRKPFEEFIFAKKWDQAAELFQ